LVHTIQRARCSLDLAWTCSWFMPISIKSKSLFFFVFMVLNLVHWCSQCGFRKKIRCLQKRPQVWFLTNTQGGSPHETYLGFKHKQQIHSCSRWTSWFSVRLCPMDIFIFWNKRKFIPMSNYKAINNSALSHGFHVKLEV
jgi:hypothetical protein